ncbi:MAG: oligosaccharide flippase family protein [Candidatus Thiodiazotropha sp. (ex Dulcina madagascariensis)]|nr:oligosaccharide flippase family protein [Candidatus Thiodiazotropha sp. (ex Dulcina madagascariensis)]
MQKQGFLRKFIRGGVWALLFRAFTVVTNLALSMLIARMLAPDQVGVYFLLVSLVSVIAVFAQAGLNIAIVRIISKYCALGNNGKVGSSIKKSLFLGLLTSLASALLLYFGGLELLSTHIFNLTAIYDYRLFISIWVVLWCLESLNAEIYRGFKQFHLAVLFKRLAPNIVIMVITVTLYIRHTAISLDDYLLVVLIGWLISLLISSLLLQKYILTDKQGDAVDFHQLISKSIPLWFTGWITFALPQLDLWILGVFESSEALALYGAATRLVMFLGLPLLIVQAVVPPLISEAHATNRLSDLTRGLQTISAISFYPGLIISLIYLISGEMVLKLVFGDTYNEAAIVLKILTIGYIIKLYSGSSQTLLMMSGHGKITMMVSITTGTLLVVGCLLVGKNSGMIGIAVVSVIALSLHSILNLIFARIQLGIWAIPWIRARQIKRYLGMIWHPLR